MSISSVAIFLCVLPAVALRIRVDRSESSDIYSFVDSSCKLTVDTKQKKVFLKSETGNFVIEKGQVYDENGKLIGKTTPKPLICESDTGPAEKSHAFIIVASSAPYLKTWLDSTFFNKHCWAKTNGMKYYLMFGEATGEAKQVYKQKSPDAVKCSEGDGDISHYMYPIAMKIILEEKPVSWLMSMDISDSWFNGAHFKDGARLMKSFFTDDLPDVAFAAQFGKSPVWLNGALWGIKNTEWSKQWLADVYKNRCGNMNQHAYWNTFLEHFKKEKPDFSYDQGELSHYQSAKYKMAKLVVPMLAPEQQKAYLASHKEPYALRETLYFGKHLAMLPNAAPNKGDAGFVGFRGDRDRGEPFACHSTPRNWMKFKQVGAEAEIESLEETEGSESMPSCKAHPCEGGATCQCEA